MHAVLGILFVFALGFEDEFLEDVVVAGDDAVCGTKVKRGNNLLIKE